MERKQFLDEVCGQLQKMSESQKDTWILMKAKLLAEADQQGFLMSRGFVRQLRIEICGR